MGMRGFGRDSGASAGTSHDEQHVQVVSRMRVSRRTWTPCLGEAVRTTTSSSHRSFSRRGVDAGNRLTRIERSRLPFFVMRITEVHVENFRGVQCATLHCGALTALVGRNGAGKSTFLHALDLFYRPNATVTSEDFTHRKTDAPIAIRVTFENLQPDEVAAFQAYIHGGRLTVTKCRFSRPMDPLTPGFSRPFPP